MTMERQMMQDALVHARKKAERAVEGMKEGPLKTAAFQTILAKLLAEVAPLDEARRTINRPVHDAQREPNTLKGRILLMKSEGFFKTQRSLGDVREGLGSRGWHYALSALSGAMQGIVQQRLLRRERIITGGRKVWKYSNP